MVIFRISMDVWLVGTISLVVQEASISSLFTDPGDIQKNIKAEEEEEEEIEQVMIKEEEIPREISTGEERILNPREIP